MSAELRATANHARFLPGQRAGFYESWFQRANHPTRPLAFWIRYTLFSPEGRPHDGAGELWAVVFDGESHEHVAVKREVPIARARFHRAAFDVKVDGATLGPASLRGEASSDAHAIAWDLRYKGSEPPLLFYPDALYEAKLPRAKLLVGAPLASYFGTVTVDGRELSIDGWVGSQNHNWGSRHTDHYAWGQVAGFDEGDDDAARTSVLEIATARLKVGGIWTPFMTPAVLRHRGCEHRASSPMALLRNRGAFTEGGSRGFTWRFSFEAEELRAEGVIEAAREDFVGLGYANPPGGEKQCLNTKIASCRLTLTHTGGPDRGGVETLVARRRAAFEILTDGRGHGISMSA